MNQRIDQMGSFLPRALTDQRGVTAIVIALVMVLFVGVAALALDIGHLYIVKNELQNAADAGCLAGARFLYINDGEDVNVGANEIAYQAAISNSSEINPVEVHWSGGNTGDVVRGHWTFATHTFTPTDNDDYSPLWEIPPEELDANPNFVNAIQVKARRENTPAASFFARIFGYENFLLSAEAVAYLGFAGTLGPGEVRQPLAICRESLLINGNYSCSVGRMMTMGGMTPGQESGGWTDFNQDAYASGPNPLTVASLVTQGQNPDPILLGLPMAVTGGDIPSAFTLLRDRWESVTGRDNPWGITLPVIECSGYSLDASERMVGAVTINILWITGPNDDLTYSDAPWEMEYPHSTEEWSSGSSDGQVRWNSFVQGFNLKTIGGSFVPYQKKAIYFVPDCHHQTPRGRTGGENFGVLAKIPVLAR